MFEAAGLGAGWPGSYSSGVVVDVDNDEEELAPQTPSAASYGLDSDGMSSGEDDDEELVPRTPLAESNGPDSSAARVSGDDDERVLSPRAPTAAVGSFGPCLPVASPCGSAEAVAVLPGEILGFIWDEGAVPVAKSLAARLLDPLPCAVPRFGRP